MAVCIHLDIASNKGLICYYTSWLELMMEKFNFSEDLKAEHSLIATDSQGRNIGCSGAVENILVYHNPIQHENEVITVKLGDPHSPEALTDELPMHNRSKEVKVATNSIPTEIPLSNDNTTLQYSKTVTVSKIVVRSTPNTCYHHHVTEIRAEAMEASMVNPLDTKTEAFTKVYDGIETAALPSTPANFLLTSTLQSGGKFGETYHSHMHTDEVKDRLPNESDTDIFMADQSVLRDGRNLPRLRKLRLDSTGGSINENHRIGLPGPALGGIESELAGDSESCEIKQKQTPLRKNSNSGISQNHRPRSSHVDTNVSNKQSPRRSKICTIL